jgi:hypothetical protein
MAVSRRSEYEELSSPINCLLTSGLSRVRKASCFALSSKPSMSVSSSNSIAKLCADPFCTRVLRRRSAESLLVSSETSKSLRSLLVKYSQDSRVVGFSLSCLVSHVSGFPRNLAAKCPHLAESEVNFFDLARKVTWQWVRISSSVPGLPSKTSSDMSSSESLLSELDELLSPADGSSDGASGRSSGSAVSPLAEGEPWGFLSL